MSYDPIVDEVHKIRDEYAKRFNYDIDAIFEDIKQKERASGRTYVKLSPRRVTPDAAERRETPTPEFPAPPGRR